MSSSLQQKLRIACYSGAGGNLRTLRRSSRCESQMALFSADARFLVYMNAKDPTPSQKLHSRDELAPVFAELNKYEATTHFVGQSTIFTSTTDRATGETYCLAHHVTVNGGKRRLMLASLRYLDTFVKIDEALVVFGAPALRRLDGKTGNVMTVSIQVMARNMIRKRSSKLNGFLNRI